MKRRILQLAFIVINLLCLTSACKRTDDAGMVQAPRLERLKSSGAINGDTLRFQPAFRIPFDVKFKVSKAGGSPIRSIAADLNGRPINNFGGNGIKNIASNDEAFTDSVQFIEVNNSWPFYDAGRQTINIKATNQEGKLSTLSIPVIVGNALPPVIELFNLAPENQSSDTIPDTFTGTYKLKFRVKGPAGANPIKITVNNGQSGLSLYSTNPNNGTKELDGKDSVIVDSLVIGPSRSTETYNLSIIAQAANGTTANVNYTLVVNAVAPIPPSIRITSNSIDGNGIVLFDPIPFATLTFEAKRFRGKDIQRIQVTVNGTPYDGYGTNGTKTMNGGVASFNDEIVFDRSTSSWPFNRSGTYAIRVTAIGDSGISWAASNSIIVREGVLSTIIGLNGSHVIVGGSGPNNPSCGYSILGDNVQTPGLGTLLFNFIYSLARAKDNAQNISFLFNPKPDGSLDLMSPTSALAVQTYGVASYPNIGIETWPVLNFTQFTGKLNIVSLESLTNIDVINLTQNAQNETITNLRVGDYFGVKMKGTRAIFKVMRAEAAGLAFVRVI